MNTQQLRHAGRILFGCALPLGLHAQQAPAPATAEPAAAADEALILSPFEVRTDRDSGYTAASTLAGGRTETSLKHTSAAISVMTSQFLEDINAFNFRDADEWAVNYTPAPEINTNGFGGHSVNYRNMGSTFASRNYFLWYVEGDSYNTERIEQARGPNGVLYGDGGAAGVGNTWTKRPRFGADNNVVRADIDSQGLFRVTSDLNRQFGSRLALRLNLLHQEGQKEWRDHTSWRRQGAHLAGIVKLTKRNNFRFEGEYGTWRKSIYPNYIVDQGSLWNRTSSYDGVTAIPSASAAGVQVIPAAESNIYLTALPNRGLMNWTGFYRSTGVANSVNLLPAGEARLELKNTPVLPHKGFNPQPRDLVGEAMYYNYTFYIDHRFSDNFFVEAAYNRTRNDRRANANPGNNFGNYSQYRLDVNRVLPGGDTNPYYGQPYTDSQVGHTVQKNMVDDVRLLANWRYRSNWLRESISFIGGSRLDRFVAGNWMLRRTDNNQNVWVRQYWSQAGDPRGEIELPGTAFVQTSGNNQRKSIDYAQIATTSQFFGDRLTISLGGRMDRFSDQQKNFNGNVSRVKVSPKSKYAGAVFFLTEQIGVFANYSETFQAPNSGNPLLDGSAAGISRGKGEDYGIKVDLFNGKILGSASYYQTAQEGRLQAGNNLAEVNAIWNALGKPENNISAFRDTNNLAGEGWEFDFTANIANRLRMTFNLALPEVAIVNVEPGLKAYVAQHLAEWQAAAADPAIATELQEITDRLSGLVEGALQNSTYKYTANVYATYSFRQGWLRGLDFGAGANIRGPQKFGNEPGDPFAYRYNNRYFIARAHLSYRHRISDKMTARYQLTISNLLNDDTPIATGFANINNGANLATGVPQVLATNVRIADPRKVSLGVTLNF